jgi:spore maturation protein CgeB
LPKSELLQKFHHHSGGIFVEKSVASRLLEYIDSHHKGESFDYIWVDNGRYVGSKLVCELKRRYGKILHYDLDDPYGTRDGRSWATYLKSVPFYDLIVVVRRQNVMEAQSRGAKKVLRVFMAADEIAHAPRSVSDSDRAVWSSDVVFVGTYFPERGPFMKELLDRGVPLKIYGGRWQRAPEWNTIKQAWKGPNLDNPEDYAKALQCSKICLGLLSKGNRDLHTTRSMEVPMLEALLCAERTTEHENLYRDGVEAVFWSDAAECAAKCHELLANPSLIESIRVLGKKRVMLNGWLNEPVARDILATL